MAHSRGESMASGRLNVGPAQLHCRHSALARHLRHPWAVALANAVFDATGVRLRTVPFTPDRVKAALAARPDSAAPARSTPDAARP